eukprot:766448-Hanusia_phi.AAC.7
MFVSSTNVLKTCTTAFSPSPWCFRPRYSERTRSCTLRRQSLRMSSGNATNSAPMEPSAELDIAARIAATAAKIAAEEAEIYNRNIGQSFRRYDPFHRAVLEKIGERMGPVDLKEIEELELDAPVNLPQIDEEPTVPLSQGRGGRFSSDRKKIQKKYYEPSLDAKKTRRHFRYKVRGGDLFVKVILTGKDFEKTYRPSSDANGFDFLRNGGSANNNFMVHAPFLLILLNLKPFRQDSLMNEGTEPGGLVLEIPKELQSIISERRISFEYLLKWSSAGTSNTGAGKKRPYPFDYYEGEQESLRAIRDFKSLPVPAPIVAGDLWDDDYIRNMRSAKKNVDILVVLHRPMF